MYTLLVTWSLLMSNGHYAVQQEITTDLTESQCSLIGKESEAELRWVAEQSETEILVKHECVPAER